ncbi:MAG: hypothetical protein KA100_04185 [Rickettsiales bacterium]|nr:hypothetical protein [Rickettsiales bacterium]
MKILELRKKIVVNAITSGACLAIFAGCVFYNIHKNDQMKKEAEAIASETSQIQAQAEEIQGKTLDIKKYIALWHNLDEKKKSTSGILKSDEIDKMLLASAIKYNISEPIIKVSFPETLSDGIFARSTITVSSSSVSISFKSLDDAKALAFVNDFTNSLPGYVVISSFDLKKDKSYSNEELIAISSGKGSGIVSGNISFFWYAFKNKNNSAAPTANKAAAPAEAKTN